MAFRWAAPSAASAPWEEGRPRPDLSSKAPGLKHNWHIIICLLSSEVQTHGDRHRSPVSLVLPLATVLP